MNEYDFNDLRRVVDGQVDVCKKTGERLDSRTLEPF